MNGESPHACKRGHSSEWFDPSAMRCSVCADIEKSIKQRSTDLQPVTPQMVEDHRRRRSSYSRLLEAANIIRATLLTRQGEVIDEQLANELANNIAMALGDLINERK